MTKPFGITPESPWSVFFEPSPKELEMGRTANRRCHLLTLTIAGAYLQIAKLNEPQNTKSPRTDKARL